MRNDIKSDEESIIEEENGKKIKLKEVGFMKGIENPISSISLKSKTSGTYNRIRVHVRSRTVCGVNYRPGASPGGG